LSLARDNYFFHPNYSMSTIAEYSDTIGTDKDNALFRDFIQTDCFNSYVIVLAIYFDPINEFALALSIQPFKKIIFLLKLEARINSFLKTTSSHQESDGV
jgi:hypothetical protein